MDTMAEYLLPGEGCMAPWLSTAAGQWGAGIALAVLAALVLFAWKRFHRRQEGRLLHARRNAWHLQAVVSHEIRTPLQSIVHLLDLSLRNVADAQREPLSAARDSARLLLELLEAMLTQSKLDAGRLELHPRSTRLGDLAQQVARMHAAGAEAKGLRFIARIDAPAEAVLCDDLRLRQILTNLLSNAVKYTPRGFVSLQVTGRRIRQRAHVEFLIGDSGIGMAPELLARLDEPFCQAGESARREHGGYGLGLHLAHALTGMLGGAMRIDSEPEIGTRIRLAFDFPLAAPEPDTQHGGAEAAVDETLRALLIEDHPASRLLLARQLQEQGLRVSACENGADGLRRWTTEHPDIVFCDMQLPGLDGLSLSKRIRRLERKLLRAPTVLVCISAGSARLPEVHPFDLVLDKPLGPDGLRHALACCLSDQAAGPVDFDVVRTLSSRNAGFEQHFLRTALASLEKDSRQLLLARRRGDLKQLSACAHRLLGVTRLMCNEGISRHCRQLETAARNLDRAEVSALLPQVRQDIMRVLHSLRRRLHWAASGRPALKPADRRQA